MQNYLNVLARQMYDVALVRSAKEGIEIDSVGLLKHCATEVVEATEAAVNYTRLAAITDGGTDFNIANPSRTEQLYNKDKAILASELADVIACALIIAGKEDLDIQTAVTDCLNKNRKRAERGKK